MSILRMVALDVFDRLFSAVWYWFGKDGIFVKNKENKKVIVASDGWYDKCTCLISVYLPSYGFEITVSVMSTQTWCLFL